MRGGIKGLKTLFLKDSPSAYYIHYFAHQLQLVLVGIAKGSDQDILNVLSLVSVAKNRMQQLRSDGWVIFFKG
jgi:hypothetical protein